MRRLAILLALLLSACGGGDGPINSAQAQAAAAAPDLNTTGMAIQRAARPDDGYKGGLSVTRDTTGMTGGTPGTVTTASFVHVIVGKLVTGFEWAHLALLDNFADAGENVAAYFQANKFGTGPTWAAVSEVSDTAGLGGAAVTHEFDNWTTGPDNGLRLGLDVLVGDARAIRGVTGSGTAQATTAIHVGASQTTPYARWRNGLILNDYLDAGIVLQGAGTRGLWFQGKHQVGIDMADAQTGTAIRLSAGQRMTFDREDRFGVHLDPVTNDLVFDKDGTATMRLTQGGDLRIAGRLTQDTQ